MGILYYSCCFAVGLFIGHIIRKSLIPSCKHKWNLIDSGDITNYNSRGEKIVKGFIKVYECEHCKKMRKEQIRLN
jgi:hypothetical protein